MVLAGEIIGGNRPCRICGGYHSAFLKHNRAASPLQIAQMAMEEFERFISCAYLRIADREFLGKLVEKLKECLNIPEYSINIYNDASIDKALLGYKPSAEKLSDARGIFFRIKTTIENEAMLTAELQSLFWRLVKKIKNKVLLLN